MSLLRATLNSLRWFFVRRGGEPLQKDRSFAGAALATADQSDPVLDKLEEYLGYRFHDPALLRQSLTHKSSIVPQKSDPDPAIWLVCNERMEFLGDAVLNCLVTEHLYHRYPDRDEGHLSKMKSLLVSRKVLGDQAIGMGLGNYIRLGSSETKDGASARTSVQSNAFEAVVGALYLDGGMDAARSLLQRTVFANVDSVINDEENANYKSTILEMSQRDGFGVPHYQVIATSGPDHAKEFHIRVEVAGVPLGEGSGANKKIAQQRAAYKALINYKKEKIISQQVERTVETAL